MFERTYKHLLVLAAALSLGLVLASAEAQEGPRREAEVVRPPSPEFERFGICRVPTTVVHCPRLSSPEDECSGTSEITRSDRRAIRSVCGDLGRTFRGREVYVDLMATPVAAEHYIYVVRMELVSTGGAAPEERVERTGSSLSTALRRASDQLIYH